MWEEIFNLAISNGLFAVLFLLLLIYVLRDSSAREKKYQNIIEKLSNSFSEMTILKDKVVDISNDVEDIKEDVTILISKNSKSKSTKSDAESKSKIA